MQLVKEQGGGSSSYLLLSMKTALLKPVEGCVVRPPWCERFLYEILHQSPAAEVHGVGAPDKSLSILIIKYDRTFIESLFSTFLYLIFSNRNQ